MRARGRQRSERDRVALLAAEASRLRRRHHDRIGRQRRRSRPLVVSVHLASAAVLVRVAIDDLGQGAMLFAVSGGAGVGGRRRARDVGDPAIWSQSMPWRMPRRAAVTRSPTPCGDTATSRREAIDPESGWSTRKPVLIALRCDSIALRSLSVNPYARPRPPDGIACGLNRRTMAEPRVSARRSCSVPTSDFGGRPGRSTCPTAGSAGWLRRWS